MMRHHFEPDAVRARQLDHSMLVRLGESLRHLSEQCRSVVPHDVARLETLASALERGERQSPAVFAHYYRLLDAGRDEQFDEADRQFVALVRMEPVASALKIKPLAPHELGANYNLYLNMMNADPSI